ncbi:hypothetical protein BC629DRAFT_1444616 [Irpex lacteus]|nr:hypothetical protein BC629DRAFT_1444616 [Irpex lacteus]
MWCSHYPNSQRSTSRPSIQLNISVRSEYLALLGDTGRTCDERLFRWLDVQLTMFLIVFYVLGNNEPRGSSLNPLRPHTHPLHPRMHPLGRHRPNQSQVQALNDFKLIRDFTPDTFVAEHRADRAWLNDTVEKVAKEEPGRRVAVFTHHAPTIEGTSDPKNQGKATSAAFATELTADPVWTAGNVAVWVFGHTHWCCDFVRGGVRVYSNQRARGDGVEGFDRFKVLSL